MHQTHSFNKLRIHVGLERDQNMLGGYQNIPQYLIFLGKLHYLN